MSERTTMRRLAFTRENYEAWVALRKRQTRRVIVPQPRPATAHPECTATWHDIGDGIWSPCWHTPKRGGDKYCDKGDPIRCPYGAVGGVLAVTEPFRVVEDTSGEHCADMTVNVEYKWGGGGIVETVTVPESHWDKPTSQPSERWHSSRFMPLWAARRFARLESLRVEQVQDISEGDAEAEGVEYVPRDAGFPCWRWHADKPYEGTARAAFAALWDSINAERGYGWSANPLVWVLGVSGPLAQNEEGDDA